MEAYLLLLVDEYPPFALDYTTLLDSQIDFREFLHGS